LKFTYWSRKKYKTAV